MALLYETFYFQLAREPWNIKKVEYIVFLQYIYSFRLVWNLAYDACCLFHQYSELTANGSISLAKSSEFAVLSVLAVGSRCTSRIDRFAKQITGGIVTAQPSGMTNRSILHCLAGWCRTAHFASVRPHILCEMHDLAASDKLKCIMIFTWKRKRM